MVTTINTVIVEQGVFGLTLGSIGRESGISPGSLLHGVGPFLPGDDDGVLLTRAWLAWCELWRSEEWLLHDVGELRARERRLLAEVHELRVTTPDLDLLVATVDGLRVAVCAPVRPMPPAEARGLLGAASAAALGRAA